VELPELLRKALQRDGAQLAGEVISNPAVEGGLFIPLRVSRDAAGKQRPSHKELANLRNDLATIGFSAELLIIDEQTKSIEEGLRASLLSSFPDFVRNSFVTTIELVAHVWIDEKRIILDNERNSIESLAQQYVEITELRGYHLYFMRDELLATNTEVLSIVRKQAPIGCEELCEILQDRGFSVPSLDWINRKFDALRKAGLLLRRSDRSYVLTSEGLRRLGTRKNRNSPDISRLLALARRGD